MEEISIEIPGYKVINAEITQTVNGDLYGYINDIFKGYRCRLPTV